MFVLAFLLLHVVSSNSVVDNTMCRRYSSNCESCLRQCGVWCEVDSEKADLAVALGIGFPTEKSGTMCFAMSHVFPGVCDKVYFDASECPSQSPQSQLVGHWKFLNGRATNSALHGPKLP